MFMADMASLNDQIYAAIVQTISPPAFVRPYFDTDADFEAMLKSISELNRSDEIKSNDWLQRGQKSRKALAEEFQAERDLITHDTISAARHFAGLIEKKADECAADRNRFIKTVRKLGNELEAAVGKQKADRAREIYRLAFNRWAVEIEEMLEMAFFMKALAGTYDPDKRVVSEARSPETLGAAFADMLGS